MADKSYMIFEVREIIQHFKDGQSFNNLQSIELEPIVRVEEKKEKIEITGHLVLNGEFFNEGLLKGDDQWKDEFEQADGLHYGTVFYGNDGAESFQYQIPLTFEIQAEKVENPSQIFVLVDNFDYNTLADNKLELIAQIKLIGVHPEPKQEKPIDTYNDFSYFSDPTIDNKWDYKADEGNEQSYSFSILKGNEEQKKGPYKEVKTGADKDYKELTNIEVKPLIKDEAKPPIPKKEKNTVKSSESQTNAETIADKAEKKVEQQETTAKKTINSKSTKEMLFSMLQSDEEKQYKLKIYLVKKDDTLESIAEKYNITASSIQKYNKLEGNQLDAGQLLYLPEKRIGRND